MPSFGLLRTRPRGKVVHGLCAGSWGLVDERVFPSDQRRRAAVAGAVSRSGFVQPVSRGGSVFHQTRRSAGSTYPLTKILEAAWRAPRQRSDPAKTAH
jgi:hypothetical protein